MREARFKYYKSVVGMVLTFHISGTTLVTPEKSLENPSHLMKMGCTRLYSTSLSVSAPVSVLGMWVARSQ